MRDFQNLRDLIVVYLVSSKLFRPYLYVYFVFTVAFGSFISSFIMLDSFTLLSRHVFNWIQSII